MSMTLGLGLSRSLITPDNLAFAKQAGATHLVVHSVDYSAGASPELDSAPPTLGTGTASCVMVRRRSRRWKLVSARFKPLDARSRKVFVDDGDLGIPRVGE